MEAYDAVYKGLTSCRNCACLQTGYARQPRAHSPPYARVPASQLQGATTAMAYLPVMCSHRPVVTWGLRLCLPAPSRRGIRAQTMAVHKFSLAGTDLLITGDNGINARTAVFTRREGQKLRKRKSLALPSTFSRIAGSGSMRAISVAPIMVEKIAKKACSLSTVRRPGMNGSIWLL